MKLVYLLQHERWFLVHERSWFKLEDGIELAASVLPLDLVDLYEIVEQPHQAGTAQIERVAEGAALVRLTTTDGQLAAERRFDFDDRLLTRVEWLIPPFRDGWYPSETRLLLEGARRYSLKLYLPPHPDAGPKTLRLHDELDGSERAITLQRDGESEVPLLEGDTGERRVVRLICEPEPAAAGDVRSLGFIVIDDRLEAA